MKFTSKQLSKQEILHQCNIHNKNTLMETLSISYTDIGEDFLEAQMPVNPKVHQPQGLLHGGATVALAETVGSTAAIIFKDVYNNNLSVRGLEISANHLKSIHEGTVIATAKVIHLGRTTQFWHIEIKNQSNNELLSFVKFTTITLALDKK